MRKQSVCPHGCGSAKESQCSWTFCTLMFEPFATFSDVHANKRVGILFSYLHGAFQVSVARVQFVQENVSFVEVRYNSQGVV